MKNVIKLFFMDLKKIAKAPSVLVILGGLALLPSFYAWFNLDATWDPYGNTKNMTRVAHIWYSVLYQSRTRDQPLAA